MCFAIRLIFVGTLGLDAPNLAIGIEFPPVGPDKKNLTVNRYGRRLFDTTENMIVKHEEIK